MSTVAILAQLELLVKKAEAIVDTFTRVRNCQNKEIYCSLETLSSRLEKAAADIAERIGSLEESRAEQVRKEGENFLRKVKETRISIVRTNHIKNLAGLRKNITLIFEGLEDSALDPAWVTSKNKQTRRSCEAIRELTSDGVVSWAAALAPFRLVCRHHAKPSILISHRKDRA